MANLDIQAGWGYQNATKHSHHSVRTNPHFLDWANQPLPFKIYPKLGLVPLPREFRESGVPALKAIAEVVQRDNAVPDLQTLSQLPYFSAGVTRRRTLPAVARSISVRRRVLVRFMRSSFIWPVDLSWISRVQ
jgi:hypothetical protein